MPNVTMLDGLQHPNGGDWRIGDRVTKISGSSWTGRICGFYWTSITPFGYCIESENEPNSVQNYPQIALKRID